MHQGYINFFWLLLAFSLILLNAFFVAAEFGMVKLRNTRVATIRDAYGLRGRILASVHKQLDAYLSACQLGITLASLGLGWIGEPAFARLLEPLFTWLGVDTPELVRVISFFIAFAIISFLHIVIGELMPKSLAIRQSEKISLWTAIPLYVFYWVMYPAIWILNTCSNFLLKITGLTDTQRGDHFYSTAEIKLILSAGHLHGELTKEEVEIIEHTLDFADLQVTEVMRPREEMIMLNIDDPISLIMKTVMEHRYSRYPIYDPKQQEIIGIIHVKDLFSNLYQQGEINTIQPLIRPVLKVSFRLPALDLLHKFREGMPHFALIYRGKEKLIGFVTLDNLLHVLIGRIKDEFHLTKEDWIINQDGSITAKGDCSIYSLEQALDHEISINKGEEDIDTLAELISNRFGTKLKAGDCFEFPEFSAVIEKVTTNHILKVLLHPKKIPEEIRD